MIPALVVLAAVAGQLWFIHADRSPLGYDQAEYLTRSLELYRGFGAAWTAPAVKAPLLCLLPAPFYWLFGPSPVSALYVNTVLLAVLSAYCWLLAERLHGRRAALFALILLNTTPLIYELSRTFLVELAAAAAACAFTYHLLAGHLPAQGAALGAGLLLKTPFPLYVAGPFLYMGRRRALVLALGAGLAATWYAFNFLRPVGFALSAGFGHTAAAFARLSPAGWVLELAWQLGPALVALRWLKPSRLLLVWLAPLLVLLAAVNREPRYAAPLLPAFAVALGAALERAPKALAAVAVALSVGRYAFDLRPRRVPAPPLTEVAEAVHRQGPRRVAVLSSPHAAALSYESARRLWDERYLSLTTRPPHPLGDDWIGGEIPRRYLSLDSVRWLMSTARPTVEDDFRQLAGRGVTHVLIGSRPAGPRMAEDAALARALPERARRLEAPKGWELYELAKR